VESEHRLLKGMGFSVKPELPFSYLLNYLKSLSAPRQLACAGALFPIHFLISHECRMQSALSSMAFLCPPSMLARYLGRQCLAKSRFLKGSTCAMRQPDCMRSIWADHMCAISTDRICAIRADHKGANRTGRYQSTPQRMKQMVC
jgi:hypothetical protein